MLFALLSVHAFIAPPLTRLVTVSPRAASPTAGADLKPFDIDNDALMVAPNPKLDKYIADLKAKRLSSTDALVTLATEDVDQPVVMGSAPSGFEWAPDVEFQSAAAALVATQLATVRRTAQKNVEMDLATAREQARAAKAAAKEAEDASAEAMREAKAAVGEAKLKAQAATMAAEERSAEAQRSVEAAKAQATEAEERLAAAQRGEATAIAAADAQVARASKLQVKLNKAMAIMATTPSAAQVSQVASEEGAAGEWLEKLAAKDAEAAALQSRIAELEARDAASEATLRDVRAAAELAAVEAQQTLERTVAEYEKTLEAQAAAQIEAIGALRNEMKATADEQQRQTVQLNKRIEELMAKLGSAATPPKPDNNWRRSYSGVASVEPTATPAPVQASISPPTALTGKVVPTAADTIKAAQTSWRRSYNGR